MTFSEFTDIIRGVGIAGILTRLILAVICGGAIGIERETKRRAAGFRTHCLICLGATLTTLTSQYIAIYRELPTDPARLGAQVIAGMSFIGAGAIIVTSRRQVKGLTTAAGLWVSAIIGLAIGTGFYEAAALTVVLVLFAELLLSRLEYYIVSTARTMNIHIEFSAADDLNTIINTLTEQGIAATDVEYTRSRTLEGSVPSATVSLRLHKKTAHESILTLLSEVKGVISVEEL